VEGETAASWRASMRNPDEQGKMMFINFENDTIDTDTVVLLRFSIIKSPSGQGWTVPEMCTSVLTLYQNHVFLRGSTLSSWLLLLMLWLLKNETMIIVVLVVVIANTTATIVITTVSPYHSVNH
jgi:hypothetical protein